MIRFAGISRRHTVLASVSSDMSDHEESLRVLLRQQGGAALKRQASFDAGVNIFHLLTHNGIVYSCLVQRDARVRTAFKFLEALKDEFLQEFGLIARTVSRASVEPEFAPRMRELLASHNRGDFDKAKQVQGALDRVTDSVRQNIDLVLEREEKITSLVDRSSELRLVGRPGARFLASCVVRASQRTQEFKASSTRLRRTFWWRSTKVYIMLGCLGLALVAAFFMYACGGVTFPQCRGVPEAPGAGADAESALSGAAGSGSGGEAGGSGSSGDGAGGGSASSSADRASTAGVGRRRLLRLQ